MTELKVNDKIETPAIDTRQYRHLTLSNSLECIIVSDPDTDKSSACCSVHTGSLLDPLDVQGLAHFLEHMLFLGTEKYPSENEYSVFLNSHGGYSNAYTSQEETVYYFDIQPNYFEKALDIFSSFFICPLFTESASLREMKAVDSENSKNLQSDSWRKFQLLKSLSRKDHPLNKFSTGNLKTLLDSPKEKKISIRDVLLEFYDKHYSANLMKLVVYGKEDLDVLQNWVVSKFSDVPNKDFKRFQVPPDPYTSSELSKIIEFVPIRDKKALDLFFPIPSTVSLYKSKPISYISHLIGHESEGSILHALKSKFWSNELGSYQFFNGFDFDLFSISIELSDEGINHIDDIVNCIFSYIGMLREKGPQEWIWNELKEVSDMRFKFLNKVEPSTYAVSLANDMHRYPADQSISGKYMFTEYNPNEIVQILDLLSPENALILISHDGLKQVVDKKEQWYGTDYRESHPSQSTLSQWNSSFNGQSKEWSHLLNLPVPNPFVATKFDLNKKEHSDAQPEHPFLIQKVTTYPDLLGQFELKFTQIFPTIEAQLSSNGLSDQQTTPNAEIVPGMPGMKQSGTSLISWFKNDISWNVPKMKVYISLESPFSCSSALQAAFAELLSEILKEILNPYSYYADCAGLSYDIESFKGGLLLEFQGFDQKIPILIQKSLQEIAALGTDQSNFTPELYHRVKESLLRKLKDFLFSQPYFHCYFGSFLSLEEPRFSHSDKYFALKASDDADFLSFCKSFIRQLSVEVYCHGSVTETTAEDISALVCRVLKHAPLPLSGIPKRRSVCLEASKTYLYRQHAKDNNPEEVNSSVENIYMLGTYTLPISSQKQLLESFLSNPFNLSACSGVVLEAFSQLLKNMISESAFDQLRTKEQLGYIVFTLDKKINNQLIGMALIVQSNHKDPDYLDFRIEEFLKDFHNKLSAFTEEEFSHFVESTIESILEKPKNIYEQSKKYWTEIQNKSYFFNRKDLLVQVLRSVHMTKENLLSFYDHFFSAQSLYRTKLSSQFFGKEFAFNFDSTKDANINAVIVQDPVAFRQSMGLNEAI